MDFVHSEVPETNAGRPQSGISESHTVHAWSQTTPLTPSYTRNFFNKRRGQESNLCLPGSEPGATTSSCRLGVSYFAKALRPGIAPDQRASKAHVASTRRRELSLKEQAPAAGIEPATKRLTVALPYQHRTHRNVKWRETDSNHRPPGYERPCQSHSELPTAPSRKAPSGSRTHTSAMARQQATATSWAQNCITTKLSKITDARGIQRAPRPTLRVGARELNRLLRRSGHRHVVLVDCR